MKKRVLGRDMVEFLGGLSPGDPVLVNGRQWTSLDDWEFEVVEDYGDGDGRVVGREEAEAMFEADKVYEVER